MVLCVSCQHGGVCGSCQRGVECEPCQCGVVGVRCRAAGGGGCVRQEDTTPLAAGRHSGGR